jgi:hypothetical protein
MTPEQQRELERFKAQLQLEVERYKADVQRVKDAWAENAAREREAQMHEMRYELSMFRAVIDFGTMTLRSLILVNGGAIIGVLTFTANLWGRSSPAAKATAQGIAPALTWFVVGLALAVAAAGVSYIAQVLFTELSQGPDGEAPVAGTIGRFVAVGAAVLSLFAFCLGAYQCLEAFKSPVMLD